MKTMGNEGARLLAGLTGVVLAVAILASPPPAAANPYHQCLFACHEDVYNQIDDLCYGTLCRFFAPCLAGCLEAAWSAWRTCVGICMAEVSG